MRSTFASFLALVLGLSSPVQAQGRISIATLGFEIEKPANWQTLTAEANAENLKKLKVDDPDFQQAISQYASVPAVAFAKFLEPHPDLNPSFKINARPFGGLAGRSATEIIALILPSLSRAFPDIKIVQQPMETQVGGQPAGYSRVTYTLVADDLAIATTSELWIVPRNGYFLMIGAGTRADEANGTRAEIQAILASLTFSSAAKDPP